jgi:hypothetical protein
MDYLRDIYGAKMVLPTDEDIQGAFQTYLADLERRQAKHQLLDGESATIVNDRVQVSGIGAVMAINEILTRMIVEKNPSREIFLEESYALVSLYGQSLPDGLVFKICHQPLKNVPRSAIESDRQFWNSECRALIGDTVQKRTSVPELCSWCERMFMNPAASHFGGDPLYAKDPQAPQYYSQCRSAIARYYDWWSKKSEKSEAASLKDEADLAHRQAYALSPFNPTTVWRYAEFLLANQRTNDARAVVQTTLNLNPDSRMAIDSDPLRNALKQLRAFAAQVGIPGYKN